MDLRLLKVGFLLLVNTSERSIVEGKLIRIITLALSKREFKRESSASIITTRETSKLIRSKTSVTTNMTRLDTFVIFILISARTTFTSSTRSESVALVTGSAMDFSIYTILAANGTSFTYLWLLIGESILVRRTVAGIESRMDELGDTGQTVVVLRSIASQTVTITIKTIPIISQRVMIIVTLCLASISGVTLDID